MNGLDSLCRENLLAYSMTMYPGLILSKHHRKIARGLSMIESGQIKRLIITAPPRHTKSLLCAEMLPPWFIGRDPSRQVIYATYGDDLSSDFGRKVKNYMTSDDYGLIFPNCEILQDSKSNSRITTTKRGVYTATSVGGSVTGKGADLLLIDDYFKNRMEADSIKIRNNCWDWYTSTARTRLQPGGAIVIVATRWHSDDIIGRLLAMKTGEWVLIELPALNENETEALWPEWMPVSELLKIRRDIGEYEFQALYLCHPTSRTGAILTTNLIEKLEVLPDPERLVLSVDSAVKIEEVNDYSVIAALSTANRKVQIRDIWRERVEYPALKQALRMTNEKHRPSIIFVEDKSSGQQIIQEMKELPIKGVKANKDKKIRAQALQDMLATGLIQVPANAPWLEMLLFELTSFPSGVHDDIVDALAHGCTELAKTIYRGAFDFMHKLHIVDIDNLQNWPRFRSLCYPETVLWWAVVTENCKIAAAETVVILSEHTIVDRSSPQAIGREILRIEGELDYRNIESGPAGGEYELFPKKGPRLADAFEATPFIEAIDNPIEGWEHIKARLNNGTLLIDRRCKGLIEQLSTASVGPDGLDIDSPGPYLQTLRYICHAYTGGGVPADEQPSAGERFDDMVERFMNLA